MLNAKAALRHELRSSCQLGDVIGECRIHHASAKIKEGKGVSVGFPAKTPQDRVPGHSSPGMHGVPENGLVDPFKALEWQVRAGIIPQNDSQLWLGNQHLNVGIIN